MLTVVTTRSPSTYIFIPSLQFNSILEKLYFCCLMLKATKFFWCWILKFIFATSVVGATRGSWLEGAGWKELMFLHYCQPTGLGSNECRGAWKSKTKISFKVVSCYFLLSVSLFLAHIGRGWRLLNLPRVIQKKKKTRELQRRSVAATRNATAPQQREL
jgi:hypothetical protein